MSSATEFYSEFNKKKNAIEEKIEGINSVDAKRVCLEDISQLSTLCKSNLHLLPHYDQKLYNEQLQKLTEKVESKTVKNKSKFAFKKKVGSGSVKNAKNTGTSASADKSLLGETTTKPAYSNLEDWYCSENEEMVPNLNISHLQRCIVKLTNSSYSTARMDSLRDCIVIVNDIEGPIYLTDVHNCFLFISCHQFRIHKSQNVHVAVSCRSRRPIIEECSQLTFANFPETLKKGEELYEWDDVDDFDWLKTTPSENWIRKQTPTNLIFALVSLNGQYAALTSDQKHLLNSYITTKLTF
jgi:hypothetical protein